MTNDPHEFTERDAEQERTRERIERWHKYREPSADEIRQALADRKASVAVYYVVEGD